jgi:5'-deoxynucleotidase YfbR-like HD superfamily hydrolase
MREDTHHLKAVLDFYHLACKLKDLVRSGWKLWHVRAERLERVAEHIFGTIMLAFGVWSEFPYREIGRTQIRDLDICEIALMLSLHELEEVIIGDITLHDENITSEEKQRRGHEAVSQMLYPLLSGDYAERLILEFDARETAAAQFAYMCDKLEANLQAERYRQAGFESSIDDCEPYMLESKNAKSWLEQGETTMTGAWYRTGVDDPQYFHDTVFRALLEYAHNEY